jgi:adenosylcobinamide-phosphate synthase
MTLIAIVLALMLEQLHALPVHPVVQQPVAQLSGFLERSFNDGRYAHGVIAWVLGVATPSLVLLVLYVYLWAYQSVVALLLSIAVLYLTMGFRQVTLISRGARWRHGASTPATDYRVPRSPG